MDGFLKKCAERERYGAWSQEEACWSSVRLGDTGATCATPPCMTTTRVSGLRSPVHSPVPSQLGPSTGSGLVLERNWKC